MIGTLLQDVRYAVRQLRHAPGIAIVVAATLAVAVAAGATLFSLLNAIALRELPIPAAERLAVLSLADQRSQAQRLFHYSTYAEFILRQKVFEHVCAYSGGGVFPLEARGVLTDAAIAAMTPDCFGLLGVRPLFGRVLGPDDAPGLGEPARVVVLGHRFWQRAFNADPKAVGDRLVVDGVPLTIVGVMTPEFAGLDVDAGSDFYIPLTLRLSGDPKRPVRFYNIVGRRHRGVSLEQAREQIAAAWPALQEATLPAALTAAQRDDARNERIQVESGASGISSLRRQYARPLAGLVSIAAVLLLVGCINLSGLLLARAAAREQQLAVALALGATRLRIVRQLMIEGLLPAFAGTLVALPLAYVACRALGAALLNGVVPLAMSLTPDARVIGAMGVVAILAGVTIGALPALAGSRHDPQRALQRGRTATPSMRRWSQALLVGQVALSLALLFVAGLFTASLTSVRSLDSGFRGEGIIFTRAWQQPGPPRKYDEQSYYPALVERLSAIPGVRSVALSHYFPAYFNVGLARQPIGRSETARGLGDVDGLTEFISPRFFETVGARIVRGRDFAWSDRAGAPPVVIINEALERKLFPAGDAIGRRIRVGADPRRQAVEVVGIASDVTVGNLRSPHVPVAFRPRMQEPQYMRVPIVTLQVGGDTTTAAAAVGPAIASFGHEYIRGVTSLADQLDASLLQERLLATVSSFFAALAALLAFVGLYALLAHAVARRAREIGLRMAIGASRRSVITLVVRDASRLVMLGVVAGVPCAIAAGRLTRTLLFGVGPSDPFVLGGSAVVFLLIGAIAALMPARRASGVDPMVVLRHD